MDDLYPKIEKPVKGKWLKIILIIVLIMWGIYEFFKRIM